MLFLHSPPNQTVLIAIERSRYRIVPLKLGVAIIKSEVKHST